MSEKRVQGIGIEQGHPPTDRIPASYSQQALWYVNAGSTDCRGYDLVYGYTLEGPLNLAILSAAVQVIVDRHASFRTNFESYDSKIWQRIDEARQAFVVRQPVASIEVALQLIDQNLQRRMDLERDALFETHIFPVGDLSVGVEVSNKTVVFFRFHHIAVDHTSIATVFSELQTSYLDLLTGIEPNLPDQPMDFGDFALRQAKEKTREKSAGRLEFWTSRVTEPLACIDLPLDHPRPSIQSFSGAEYRLPITPELNEGTAAFSRQNSATQFVTLLTCFAVLISRYTRHQQQVIGVPFAIRSEDEALEGVVGLLMNTLPIPISVDEELSFSEHIEQCKKTMLHVQTLQDVPLQHIAEVLPIVRDPSFNPIYQVGFSMQPGQAKFVVADCTSKDLQLHAGGAPYDLQVWIMLDSDQQLEVRIWYDDALFMESTVDRLARNYLALVETAIARPLEPLKGLRKASSADITLLDQLQGPVGNSERPCNLALQVFQGARDDSSAALVCGEQHLTHKELRTQSFQFASYLQTLALDPALPVGVMLDRQLELCPTLLGLLAQQICYVPMDPEYPRELLEYVIADSGVTHLFVSATVARNLRTPDTVTLHVIEDIWPTILELDPEEKIDLLDPEKAAYVIYTSGSTGHPKGVTVPHRAATNFIASMISEPGLTSEDRLLAVTTLSFDISVLELYGPLTVGACVVLASKEETRDVSALQKLLVEKNVTVMQATPSTWRLLVDCNEVFSPGFRAWSGGEALPTETARDLLPRVSELWNLYGPTETTVWSTIYRVHAAEQICIGSAINNTTLYVLDEQLQRVSIGIPGELYIGGEGVASGYLNREELTQQRFIDNPFKTGARLYRTGDLVRYGPSGNLYHLGRLDNQVKIRGFRVELGQIEASLEESDDVSEAVVVAKEVKTGDQRIIAYVVPREGLTTSANEFRKLVRSKVPDYMVPQFFVILDRLPRTPNGKLDRNALPELNIRNFENSSREPSTPTQQQLAQIWTKLIGIESVSTSDNFFAIGGHSMLAFQALLEINTEFGCDLKLPTILLSTLSEIAQHIDQLDSPTEHKPETEAALTDRVGGSSKRGVVRRLVGKIFSS